MIKLEEFPRSYYKGILKCLSYAFVLVGIIAIATSLLFLFYPEEKSQMQCFAIPGIIYLFIGYLIHLFTQTYGVVHLKKNSGSLIVILIWIISIFLGAIPLYLTKEFTFMQAIFEATSGFTTTGFTVCDVENATHMVLMYRSLLHLLGGVGFILILSLLVSNLFGMQLFKAEGHGDKLEPSVAFSARTILLIYLGLIIGGTVLFTAFGMPLFDSINHAISAVATGGFSTKAQSIGYWHSVPIDITAIVLMLLGSTNFMTTMLILKGKIKEAFLNSETLITLFLISVATPIVIVQLLITEICPNTLSAIDNALFQVVSILTTTGLSTVDNFLPRAGFAAIPLLLLMLVGGNSGSTAGGIKAYRVALAVRTAFYDARSEHESNRIHRGHHIYRYGKLTNITKEEQSSNSTYIILYLLIATFLIFAFMLCGNDFEYSVFNIIAALGTVGMAYGAVDATTMSNPEMIIFVIAMLIARLEVYIFITGASRIVADFKEIFKKDDNQ